MDNSGPIIAASPSAIPSPPATPGKLNTRKRKSLSLSEEPTQAGRQKDAKSYRDEELNTFLACAQLVKPRNLKKWALVKAKTIQILGFSIPDRKPSGYREKYRNLLKNRGKEAHIQMAKEIQRLIDTRSTTDGNGGIDEEEHEIETELEPVAIAVEMKDHASDEAKEAAGPLLALSANSAQTASKSTSLYAEEANPLVQQAVVVSYPGNSSLSNGSAPLSLMALPVPIIPSLSTVASSTSLGSSHLISTNGATSPSLLTSSSANSSALSFPLLSSSSTNNNNASSSSPPTKRLKSIEDILQGKEPKVDGATVQAILTLRGELNKWREDYQLFKNNMIKDFVALHDSVETLKKHIGLINKSDQA